MASTDPGATCAGCLMTFLSGDPCNPRMPRRWGGMRNEKPAGTAGWYCVRVHRTVHALSRREERSVRVKKESGLHGLRAGTRPRAAGTGT